MADIDALEAALIPLLAAIAQPPDLKLQTLAPPAALDLQQIRNLPAHLETLLADDDTRVNPLWYDSASLIEAALGAVAIQIQREIEGFEYGKTLQTLRT